MSTIRPETTGRKVDAVDEVAAGIGHNKGPPLAEVPKLALTIPEFCKAHGISEAFYFELRKQGRGPRTMNVGRRRLISIEEAQRWRESNTTKDDAVRRSPALRSQ